MASERDLLFSRPDRLPRLLRRLNCSKQRLGLAVLAVVAVFCLCALLVSVQERRIHSYAHGFASGYKSAGSGKASQTRRPNSAVQFPFARGGSATAESDGLTAMYPLARGVCGTRWPEAFAALQAKALFPTAGSGAPPRFSVLRAKCGDLPQRLAATVTVALHALVSGRAFEIDWWGNHYLWDALSSHFIDWRYTLGDVSGDSALLLDFWEEKHLDNATSSMLQSDVSRIGENFPTVTWTRRSGITSQAAAENPFLAESLYPLGLRPQTTFACLFDFLFRPTPAAIALFQAELKDLLDPQVLHVAIEIFTAPAGGPPDAPPTLDAYTAYFDCARELEKQLALPGQRVTWLLVTDSAVVRSLAQTKYGNKLLPSSAGSVPLHLDEDGKQDLALGAAAMELWLMSLADAHVITQQSAAGRLGATLSMRWQRTFVIKSGEDGGGGGHRTRSCQLPTADSFADVTSGWTGI